MEETKPLSLNTQRLLLLMGNLLGFEWVLR